MKIINNLQTTSRFGIHFMALFAGFVFSLCMAAVADAAAASSASTGGACTTTTGATGAIKLSNVASRLAGIAPFSVFFDATGTIAAATKQPFHDLEYRWDFGDEKGSLVSGTTWRTGSRDNDSSRNKATGPVAAHVFEVAGSYTVALTAADGCSCL